MPIAAPASYLAPLVAQLEKQWPANRTVRIVCHGHSVPSGYFRTPEIRPFDSYPHLLHRALNERFPFAPISVMVTAIGGEHSESGATRFAADVLSLKPDLVTIDYALNDRGLGLARAAVAWTAMISACAAAGVPVLLLTPTWASDAVDWTKPDDGDLAAHARQIRALAERHGVGLADSSAAWLAHARAHGGWHELLSQINHPSRLGHDLVARELLRWFPV